MKRVILTGGAGFVGANLARRLVQDGHEVHLFVRPQHNPWRIADIRAAVRPHTVDLLDEDRLGTAVAEIRPEWIFHLAAYGAYPFQNDLRRMLAVNLQGTINLVQACLQTGFEAFVNTGSSSEYGFKDHPPAETEWLEPNSHYAVTKAAATLYCRYTAQSRHVHLVTLRLYSVYGPYEEPSRLMPTLIISGLAGRLPPLAHPDTARDYVYIDDVITAYCLAASRPPAESGAVYNVGTARQTSLRQVIETAREVLALTAEPQWGSLPSRQWDTAVWVADNRKILAELDWQPRYTFEMGFRQMTAWFQEQPARLDFYRRQLATPGTAPTIISK